MMGAAAGLAVLTLLLSQAAAQSPAADHPSCNPFRAQIAAARGDKAALETLKRSTPGHCTRTRAAIDAAMPAPPPPPPVVVSPPVPPQRISPPPPPPRDPEADLFAAADTCAEMRDYQSRYPNGRFRAQARAFLSSETCKPRPSPPAPGRVSPPPPPPRIAALDARTTPASTRAPLVSNPASLPDFALFRECEGCPEMVVIPAGSFQMGSPASESGRYENEDTQAGAGGGTLRVSVRRFAISRFETTWDEWTACVNAGACNQGPVDGAGGDNGWGRGSRPIIEVDWYDAAAYAIFVGGRAGAASAYRLPTEAEWEYAARAGTSTRWSFGDGEGQLGAYAWFSANSQSRTQLVGAKVANPWGLYDMHGNVWEWVEDCYNESLTNTPTNGAANTTGSCAGRVIRGGSWGSNPQDLRSASRGRDAPADRNNDLGFRLSRTL